MRLNAEIQCVTERPRETSRRRSAYAGYRCDREPGCAAKRTVPGQKINLGGRRGRVEILRPFASSCATSGVCSPKSRPIHEPVHEQSTHIALYSARDTCSAYPFRRGG